MQEGEAGAGDDADAINTAIIATRIRPLHSTKAAAELSAL